MRMSKWPQSRGAAAVGAWVSRAASTSRAKGALDSAPGRLEDESWRVMFGLPLGVKECDL
jgi:hypothetical protein